MQSRPADDYRARLAPVPGSACSHPLAWHGFFSSWFLLLPAAAFAALVAYHARVLRRRAAARRAILFYDRGLARIDDRRSAREKQATASAATSTRVKPGAGHAQQRDCLDACRPS